MADEWDEETTANGNSDPGLRTQTASRNRATLTVLTGTAAGHMFKVRSGASLIGRAQNAEIRLVDDGVSRQHASLRFDGKTLQVNDLDSRNGTFVNGNKLTGPTSLDDGDKIQVGRTTVLRFAYHDALDETFHENLLSSALRDGLTKLFNKRYLMDRLDSELKFARRHDTAVGLLLIDLDHFKAVNDQHGHLGGDAVLASFAQALVKAVRNEDVVARFGGEELAVVLRATAMEQSVALAERLRKLLEQTAVPFNDGELHATVSIGVAGYPLTQADSVAALIEAADKALYRAKNAGRNRVSR